MYEMAAMSEQYFNRNEPKSHFKINLYIHQLIQMSLCEGAGGGLRGVSGGGMNLLLYSTSLSVTSQARQRCARFFMSFIDVQYVGTQVQVNETEWMKWTKIVFFQRVWLLKQQMSVLKLGLALDRNSAVECVVKCNWNDVPGWVNARFYFGFFFPFFVCWHLGRVTEQKR